MGVSCQFSVNIVGGIVLMHGNWCNSWTSRRSFAADGPALLTGRQGRVIVIVVRHLWSLERDEVAWQRAWCYSQPWFTVCAEVRCLL